MSSIKSLPHFFSNASFPFKVIIRSSKNGFNNNNNNNNNNNLYEIFQF